MGSWGTGNLENDTAGDFLCMEIEKYSRRVKETVEKFGMYAVFWMYHQKIAVTIDILFQLASMGNAACYLPKPEEICRWKKLYMEIWEKLDLENWIDNLGEQRQKVLNETFNRLIELAKSVER